MRVTTSKVAILAALMVGPFFLTVQPSPEVNPVAGEARLVSAAASRSDDRMALGGKNLVVTPVTLTDGDTPKQLGSNARTVRDLLLDENIVLEPTDKVNLDLATPLEGQAIEVTITRIHISSASEEIITPHAQTRVEDPNLLVGTETLVQQGSDGVTRNTYETEVTSTGEELSRHPVTSITVSDPVEHIVAVGTKPVPVKVVAPAPAPAAPAPSQAPAAAPTNATPGSSRAIAQEKVAAKGWGESQFTCLEKLWQKESGWNHLAENRSSGAYGIPQSLPGSKMASVASDWRTNPSTQITWGLDYISGRYGTPCDAWGHSQNKGWY